MGGRPGRLVRGLLREVQLLADPMYALVRCTLPRGDNPDMDARRMSLIPCDVGEPDMLDKFLIDSNAVVSALNCDETPFPLNSPLQTGVEGGDVADVTVFMPSAM